MTPEALVSTSAYVDLARDHGLEPAQMALAFCASRPFLGSVILGATTMDQLRTDLGPADVTLGADVLEKIAADPEGGPAADVRRERGVTRAFASRVTIFLST